MNRRTLIIRRFFRNGFFFFNIINKGKQSDKFFHTRLWNLQLEWAFLPFEKPKYQQSCKQLSRLNMTKYFKNSDFPLFYSADDIGLSHFLHIHIYISLKNLRRSQLRAPLPATKLSTPRLGTTDGKREWTFRMPRIMVSHRFRPNRLFWWKDTYLDKMW